MRRRRASRLPTPPAPASRSDQVGSRTSSAETSARKAASANRKAASRRLGAVLITFDDGFRDVFENALPVMQQHRFCGIQFLVSDLIGKTNEWQQRAGDVIEPLMEEAQVRGWLATGNEIGSHTRTHPWLTRLSAAEAREEIAASKKALQDRFGVAVEHFCYPYGDWSEGVRDLVIEAGYKTACTTKSGVNTSADSAFALKRFTARYPSRNLRALWLRARDAWQSS